MVQAGPSQSGFPLDLLANDVTMLTLWGLMVCSAHTEHFNYWIQFFFNGLSPPTKKLLIINFC